MNVKERLGVPKALLDVGSVKGMGDAIYFCSSPKVHLF